jgi:nucleotidyltransferase/DNA polymerase involved in DNA repair
MDHFFTAIETREQTQYREEALIVGADPKKGRGRGVVSTCNYHARKYGIASGMPISQAWRLCPTAIFLPPNYHLYRNVSNQIMKILQTHCPYSEPCGIDEAFLDMSDILDDFQTAHDVAQIIKQDILTKTELTCSIGIAPTKLIAKMASEFQKPDGLTVVQEADIIQFISPLSVRKIWGVGKKTQQKMNAIGIRTINDLLHREPRTLINLFGAKTRYITQLLHGITPQRRKTSATKRRHKSISKEHTFSSDLRARVNQNEIFRIIDDLATKIHAKATKRQYWFKTITIKIRYDNFETHTYSSTLRLLTCQRQQLCDEAHRLGHRHLSPNRDVRLIGVKISNIQHVAGQQTLFA